MVKPHSIPVVALAVLLLCGGLACGKEALYEGGDDARLSTVQSGANPGPNQLERVSRFAYDSGGRLSKRYSSGTYYSGFNLRDNAPGNVSSLNIDEYFYDEGDLVRIEIKSWRNGFRSEGCPVTDESCYDLLFTTTFSEFSGGLPAKTSKRNADGRLLSDCTNAFDSAGRLTAQRCASSPASPGGDSAVVTAKRFYDERGNIRQYFEQNERAILPQFNVFYNYHPTLLNPFALTGLPPYANPVSRNLAVEQDGVPSTATYITDGNLVRALVFDDKVGTIYRYED